MSGVEGRVFGITLPFPSKASVQIVGRKFVPGGCKKGLLSAKQPFPVLTCNTVMPFSWLSVSSEAAGRGCGCGWPGVPSDDGRKGQNFSVGCCAGHSLAANNPICTTTIANFLRYKGTFIIPSLKIRTGAIHVPAAQAVPLFYKVLPLLSAT